MKGHPRDVLREATMHTRHGILQYRQPPNARIASAHLLGLLGLILISIPTTLRSAG
jgi:hypothetical protein